MDFRSLSPLLGLHALPCGGRACAHPLPLGRCKDWSLTHDQNPVWLPGSCCCFYVNPSSLGLSATRILVATCTLPQRGHPKSPLSKLNRTCPSGPEPATGCSLLSCPLAPCVSWGMWCLRGAARGHRPTLGEGHNWERESPLILKLVLAPGLPPAFCGAD